MGTQVKNIGAIAVPGTSAGLVSASGVPGNTTGSAIASGYVGEYIANNRSSNSPNFANNTWCSVDTGNSTLNDGAETGITLGAGIWDISGMVFITPSATVTLVAASYGTGKGTSVTGQVQSQNYVQITSTSGNTSLAIPTWRVNISSSTTYYLKAFASFSSGTVNAIGIIRATRIA